MRIECDIRDDLVPVLDWVIEHANQERAAEGRSDFIDRTFLCEDTIHAWLMAVRHRYERAQVEQLEDAMQSADPATQEQVRLLLGMAAPKKQ